MLLSRHLKQPVYLVIAAQLLFVFLGVQILHSFSIDWLDVGIAVASAAAVELFCASMRDGHIDLFFPASAVATGLGFALFLRAVSPWYFALASVLAITSKYLLRYEGAHLFNPSNFALTLLAFCLPSAVTVEFTQWGTDARVFVLISTLSLFVAYRARALPITLSFGAAYTAVLIALVSLAPDKFSPHHYGLLGPTLVIFASFMITDPKTAPRRRSIQIAHGVTVALFYFALEITGVRYALFAASFLTAAVSGVPRVLLAPIRVRADGARLLVLVLSCACLVSAACLYLRPSMSMNPLRISPSFLLFGIDGERLRSCATHPLYEPALRSGLERADNTVGASWGDYNGDGYDDLFVSSLNGGRLYRNNGDGTFTDVTRQVGLPIQPISSAVFVDYDNNGTLDLVVSAVSREPHSIINVARPEVFKNSAGYFVDATTALGLNTVAPLLGSGYLSFGDYDGDGKLDFVFTSSGLLWDPIDSTVQPAFEKAQRDVFYNGTQSLTALCGTPEVASYIGKFKGLFSASDTSYLTNNVLPLSRHACLFYAGRVQLTQEMTSAADAAPIARYVQIPGSVEVFRNVGSGFRATAPATEIVENAVSADATTSLLVQNQRTTFVSGRFYQPLSFDYDADGRQDIFIAADLGRNILLKNRGGFTFSDATVVAGMDYYASGMGADVADINGDGKPDIAVSNVAEDYLFQNAGAAFKNLYRRVPLSVNGSGWGISFVDVNNDGLDDIYVTNGLAEAYSPDRTSAMAATRSLFLTDELLQHNSDGTFADVTGSDICPMPRSGKALAVADFDNNGTPDIFTGSEGTGNELWVNHADARAQHYLSIVLRGVDSNRMGVGAAVTVSARSMKQTKYLLAGSGFGSQNSSRLLFGLGNFSGPVTVEVRWPSNRVTDDRVTVVDRDVVITER